MTPSQITWIAIIIFVLVAIGHAWLTNKWGEKLREWREKKIEQKRIKESKSG